MLRLIVTSRNESEIRRSFSLHIAHQPFEIPTGTPSASSDIQLYLKHEFAKILEINTALSNDWPGADVVASLADRAAGIFVWATTVMRFVSGADPEGQLERIMALQLPTGDIHALYRELLESSFPSKDVTTISAFQAVIGPIVVAQIPLGAADWTVLLPDLRLSTIHSITEKLTPVLDCKGPLRFIHQSFIDFLLGLDAETYGRLELDRASCPSRFLINSAIQNARIFRSALILVNKLAFTPSVRDVHIALMDSCSRLHFEKMLPLPLRYACLYWGGHLSTLIRPSTTFTSYPIDDESKEPVQFVSRNITFWLVVILRLDALDIVLPSLSALKRWMTSKLGKVCIQRLAPWATKLI